MTRTLITVAIATILLTACGSGGTSSTYTIPSPGGTETSVNTTDLNGRPSSPAHIRIVSPAPGQPVTGSTMHVVVQVGGATITTQTTKNISPTTGHVHLYVDQVLIFMAYTLQQDVPVHPGTFQLQAEFVAADHAPFNPRVLTSEIVTVTG